MKHTFWTSEKLLSLSALLVSLLTLMVFIYQTTLIRKQQYMAVYPHLKLAHAASGSLDYRFQLSNKGIGPAMIHEIVVSDSNGNVYENMGEFLLTRISIKDSIWPYNSDIYEGQLIQAGESIDLFGLMSVERTDEYAYPPNTVEGSKKLRTAFNDGEFQLKIIYESIYGERWEIKWGELSPEKL
ncbi:MAG: hypothetical protein AAF696_39530 [Bacteroidota bacterium]